MWEHDSNELSFPNNCHKSYGDLFVNKFIKAIALYDFATKVRGELSFLTNDIMTVTSVVSFFALFVTLIFYFNFH